MKTLQEIFSKYDNSDKGSIHSYLKVYSELFAPYRESATCILEVGVRYGASLCAFQEYFPNAIIHGIDNGSEVLEFGKDLPNGMWKPDRERIEVHYGDSDKPETLIEVGNKVGPWDLIVEDGSHLIHHQIATFKALFPFVKNDGLYICEDLEGLWAAEEFVKECGGEIIDRREILGRHDDILVIVRR